MFRTVFNAVILPLEFLSLGLTSGEHPAGAPWWLLAATVATACPRALQAARKLFGEGDESERSPPA